MGHYIKHKKNYLERKIFDKNVKFDLEILRYQKLEINKARNLFKKYVELVCLKCHITAIEHVRIVLLLFMREMTKKI